MATSGGIRGERSCHHYISEKMETMQGMSQIGGATMKRIEEFCAGRRREAENGCSAGCVEGKKRQDEKQTVQLEDQRSLEALKNEERDLWRTLQQRKECQGRGFRTLDERDE